MAKGLLLFGLVLGLAQPVTSGEENRSGWTSLEHALGSDAATAEDTTRLLIDIGEGAIPILVQNLNSSVSYKGHAGLLAKRSTYFVIPLDEEREWPDCSKELCRGGATVGEAAAYLIRWILVGQEHAGTTEIVLSDGYLTGDGSDYVTDHCKVMDFLGILKHELSQLDPSDLALSDFDLVFAEHGASFSAEPQQSYPRPLDCP